MTEKEMFREYYETRDTELRNRLVEDHLYMSIIKPMTEEYEDYLHDESRTGGGRADSISFPGSEEEVSAVMKECAEAGTSVTVQGGRTGLTAAAVPYGGHLMNLSKMDRIGDIEEDERGAHIKVQPGVLLEKLNEHISVKRPDLFFPPDPTETTADIGGMIVMIGYGWFVKKKNWKMARRVVPDPDSVNLKKIEAGKLKIHK